jgi:hypothetical protein
LPKAPNGAIGVGLIRMARDKRQTEKTRSKKLV